MVQQGESSVLFGLREIMDLERERIAAEERTARSANAHRAAQEMEAARARQAEAECTRVAEHERVREEREEAARIRAEYDAAILRVRLEVEASETTERERLDREHERALKRLDLEVRSRRLVRVLAALLVTGAAVVAAGYGLVLAPVLRAARDGEVRARRMADATATENLVLRRRLHDADARVGTPVAPPRITPEAEAIPSVVPAPKAVAIRVGRAHPNAPALRPPERDTSLDVLESGDLDPLIGLDTDESLKRR